KRGCSSIEGVRRANRPLRGKELAHAVGGARSTITRWPSTSPPTFRPLRHSPARRRRRPRTGLCLTVLGGLVATVIGLTSRARLASRQLDIAVDLKFEVNTADRNNSFHQQRVAAFQLTLRISGTHRRLKLALGHHSELPEELAYAGVEGFLIHGLSP